MIRKPRVAVLLSTFNGSQFLDELLMSLLRQENVNFDIFIRDDGSQDATLEKIKYFESISTRIQVVEDKFGNIGPSRSFHRLLKLSVASKKYEYYAFSDQDDIWMSNKLISGIDHILQNSADSTKPILYASQVTAIDRNKNTIHHKRRARNHFGYKNSLIENSAIGTTILLNSAAARVLAQTPPCFNVSYDAWYYLVISYVGSTYLDDRSFIQYRRHDATHTEFSTGIFRRNRIIRFMKGRHQNFFVQAYSFRQSKTFKKVSVEKREYLNNFLNGITATSVERWKFLWNFPILRNSRLDAVILKTSIFAKRFAISNESQKID
jgi:glycosyltransferase involved in cell wall biosynthesis